jgi:hypothetical protein
MRQRHIFGSNFLLISFLSTLWLPPTGLQAAETVAPNKPQQPSSITLPRTGQISTYDQAGKVIDFQGSGQDGEFQRGTVWPDPRFIVNRNGTLTDALTGLMWLKEGNCFGDLPWPSALKAVAAFNNGVPACHDAKSEYQDWFLPDLHQLATLIDAQAKDPKEALRLAGFTDLQNGTYWSSTAYHGQLNAWGVDLTNGALDLHSKLESHFLLVARVDTPAKNLPAKDIPPEKSAPDKKAQGPPPSNQRFIDNGDGTITDTKTGLMWLQDGSCLQKHNWQETLTAMRTLTSRPEETGCAQALQKYPDWSLPNTVEIKSLLDYEADYPALSSGHPFRSLSPLGYWTSTSLAAAPEQAFMVDLNTGTMRPAAKTEPYHALAVRQVVTPADRPRKESGKSGNLGVAEQYMLVLDPAIPSEIDWPPAPRFFDNGDGTSLDAITGITWLTDAHCLGRMKWSETTKALQAFNASAKGFSCADYEAGFDDWQMPTLTEMRELLNKDEKDSAAWLNSQGLKNVQGNALYWTATPTPINLYFADAINMKTGKAGNYPKPLKFMVWPKRKAHEGAEESLPLLNMTTNAIDNLVTLSPQDPLSLAVYLHTFGARMPADFWFWFETPDEKRLWLTHIRTWTDQVTPVYQGPLFNLKNYEIYRSMVGLAPGVYEFHFAIDTTPNGIFDEPRHEVKSTVIVN